MNELENYKHGKEQKKMQPTALIYSSHNRCEYLHRSWIIERALQSPTNKTIFHLSFSQGSLHNQEYDYGNFRWYYERFRQYGLHHSSFFWTEDLSREDVDFFFRKLWSSEVVVLGGGSSALGLERYKRIGELYYGDRDLFRKMLFERQNRGLLTVGFSAGADQLCQYMCEACTGRLEDPRGFGLARNVITTLHHEPARIGEIYELAGAFPECMTFGLPNDSGIAVTQNYLWSGNTFQLIEFITDNSWDKPEDQFHIKTRMGVKIDHIYNDGRHWAFNGGDRLLRCISPDGNRQEAVIITNQGEMVDYWTQGPTSYSSIEDFITRN